MKRILIFLWTGVWNVCDHEWKQIDKTAVYKEHNYNNVSNLPMYYECVLQCEKCGDIKKVKI